MIGAKFDFIFGTKIKEPGFLQNIRDPDGYFINNNGSREAPGIFERGYVTGLLLGKIFNLSPIKSDNGLFIQSGAGFIQHRITIYDRDNTIYQVKNPYKKGYDPTGKWLVFRAICRVRLF